MSTIQRTAILVWLVMLGLLLIFEVPLAQDKSITNRDNIVKQHKADLVYDIYK